MIKEDAIRTLAHALDRVHVVDKEVIDTMAYCVPLAGSTLHARSKIDIVSQKNTYYIVIDPRLSDVPSGFKGNKLSGKGKIGYFDYDEAYGLKSFFAKQSCIDQLIAQTAKGQGNYLVLRSTEFKGRRDPQITATVSATPYTALSQDDITTLKRTFYKNVRPEIVTAMKTLGIVHYVDLYQQYKEGTIEKRILEGLRNPDGGDTCNFTYHDKEMTAWLMGDTANAYYGRDAATNKPTKEIWKSSVKNMRVLKKNIHFAKKTFGEHFFEFFNWVVTLPDNKQDASTNDLVFSHWAEQTDYRIHMQHWYEEGRADLFNHYFPLLGESQKQRVVADIPTAKSKNTAVNSMLFKEGYDIPVEYLELYKTDPDAFIAYFKKSNKAMQRTILADIINPNLVSPGDPRDEAYIAYQLKHLVPDIDKTLAEMIG